MDCNERILLMLETAALPISLDTLRVLMPDIDRDELNAAILDLAFQEKIAIGKRGLTLPGAKTEMSAVSSPYAPASSPYAPASSNRPTREQVSSEFPPWPWPELADDKPVRPSDNTRQRAASTRHSNIAPAAEKTPATPGVRKTMPATPDVRKKYASLNARTVALAKDTFISDVLDYAPILKRLKSIGVFTIADYMARKESEILAIRGFGLKKLEDVNSAIDQWMTEVADQQDAAIPLVEEESGTGVGSASQSPGIV